MYLKFSLTFSIIDNLNESKSHKVKIHKKFMNNYSPIYDFKYIDWQINRIEAINCTRMSETMIELKCKNMR